MIVMVEARVDRRLAAILAADIAGYSRLMGVDEEGTLAALKRIGANWSIPKSPSTAAGSSRPPATGCWWNSSASSMLCAAPSTFSAAWPSAMLSVPPENRIEFRIGINVGDIISDDNDIYGDGVNVAARLEALAEPGGIMVSRNVHDQVRDKLSFGFEDMGEQTVKNIARPIGVHRVSLVESAAPSVGHMAHAAGAKTELSSSDRPSIAVLPFTNMSGDPEQEYFADGISEDIITGLSKLRWFFVIARNSSFTYKGKAVDIKRVARELGVRYVLEGSVRKGGNQRAHHRSADRRRDGQSHLGGPLRRRSDRRLRACRTRSPKKLSPRSSPNCWRPKASARKTAHPRISAPGTWSCRRIRMLWRHDQSRQRSRDCHAQESGRALSRLCASAQHVGVCIVVSMRYRPELRRSRDIKDAATLASRAAELDDSDPWAHLALGYAAFLMRRTDEAVEEFQRALEINPNFAAAHGYLGHGARASTDNRIKPFIIWSWRCA